MNTILTQGSFTSDGLSRVLRIPSGCDYFQIFNYTLASAYTANSAFRWTWQYGMGDNNAIHETNLADHFFANTAAIVATGGAAASTRGITVFDSTTQTPSAARATTATTPAANPVVSAANTASLFINETVIRLYSIANTPTICGIDYTVTAVTNNTNFTLPSHRTALPAGGAGTYRIISYTADPLFYPTNRTVINVAVNGTQANITTSVRHYYAVGMKVRFNVPASCGMTELNGQVGTITAVNTGGNYNLFTVDIDVSTYTAFEWPLLADVPCSYANVSPAGEDSTLNGAAPGYANLFSDAVYNQGYKGVLLGAGIPAAGPDLTALRYSPAGRDGDVLYWTAYKSFNL
jgi:hypothetical protein